MLKSSRNPWVIRVVTGCCIPSVEKIRNETSMEDSCMHGKCLHQQIRFVSSSYTTLFNWPIALIECLKRRGLCWRDNSDKMGSPGRWRSFIRLFQVVHTLEHQFIIFPPILQLKSLYPAFQLIAAVSLQIILSTLM